MSQGRKFVERDPCNPLGMGSVRRGRLESVLCYRDVDETGGIGSGKAGEM